MKCPICEQEMLGGKVAVYEFGNLLQSVSNTSRATIKFIPDDKEIKPVKTTANADTKGYLCPACNKIVVIADV